MVGEASRKRQRHDGYKRKHDRGKFRKTTNATVHRKDLGSGLKGFLFSCTPHHEKQCFRDGVLLLSRFCEEESEASPNSGSEKKAQSLEDDLTQLRSEEGKIFTRVDGGCNGSVFVKINDEKIDIEHVVESALRDARQRGNPGSRHCIRLLPIYTTCYAKAEDAAKAAMGVVKEHFPKIEDSPVSYAIAFRSRINNSAKRDDFIPAIAAAVEEIEPRYKVNLTKPDVVLLVEVLKTSCCIGVFRHYYQLAKMNLREAACPSKPKELKEERGSAEEKDEKDGTSEARKSSTQNEPEANPEQTPEQKMEPKKNDEAQVAEKTVKADIQTQPNEKTEQNPGNEGESQNVGQIDEARANDNAEGGENGEPAGNEVDQGGAAHHSEAVSGHAGTEQTPETKEEAEQGEQKT